MLEDKFIRYTKLYIIIFLMFLLVPALIGLIFGLFYGFSKLVHYSRTDYLIELLIITMPSAVFSTAYIIFYKRTANHPVQAVKWISRFLFAGALCICGLILVTDIIRFYTLAKQDISDYRSFSIAFMAGNVGLLFLIAIIQAFTTQKETDWIDRRRQQEGAE
ncbi:MAG: hypothetical protein IPI66_10995 [Chitinophagaceae bacterium]|nr:hypothetical protein [Chitinophagaceae bacterium]